MLRKILGLGIVVFVLCFAINQSAKACNFVVQQVVPNQIVVSPNFVSPQVVGFDVFGNAVINQNFTPITFATGNSVTTILQPNNAVFLPSSVIVNRGIIFRNRLIIR